MKYRLQYFDETKTITHEFNAELCAGELITHLRDFLAACSWSDYNIEGILRTDLAED